MSECEQRTTTRNEGEGYAGSIEELEERYRQEWWRLEEEKTGLERTIDILEWKQQEVVGKMIGLARKARGEGIYLSHLRWVKRRLDP